MAGTIIADYIRTDANKLSLNVGNTTFATINASGLFSNTGVQIINQNGQLQSGGVPDGIITQSKLASPIAGNGPIFSVYLNNNQAVSNYTETKVAFASVEYDTANCYNTSTYRFTPNVAGYYQFNAALKFGSNISGQTIIFLHKNGAEYKRGTQMGAMTNDPSSVLSTLVYLNGTTDYVEIYGYRDSGSGTSQFNGGSRLTYFNGFLARAA